MAVTERELAHVDRAKAHQIDEYLLLRITGELPTACHSAFLERSLLTVEPPEFIAGRSVPPDAFCPQVVTPYEHQDVFRVGARRDTITLRHAGDPLTVEVEELVPAEDRILSPGGASLALVADEATPGREAVGYSRDFDFGEAFRDAIGKLPPQSPGVPDWLSTYTVTAIFAEIGGLAGFNHLAVKVRG